MIFHLYCNSHVVLFYQNFNMGCGASYLEQRAYNINSRIEDGLQKEREKAKREVKMLLLGAGESGKSTIVKQMRIIHGNGYTPEDCMTYRPVIYSNTIESLFAILHAMKMLKIDFSEPSRHDDVRLLCAIASASPTRDITVQMGDIIELLWSDRGLQICYSRSKEYQLNDSAGYYLNDIRRISDLYYCPTVLDVLKTRVRTIGIMETQFMYKHLLFRMVDVGGQRSERKKWLYCFEGVHAIIFCVALSGYDLVLEEDEGVNRIVESMKLFESIVNNRWFIKTSIIIFFNKKDLFQEKIKYIPLTVCFTEYDGLDEYEEAVEYVRRKFELLNGGMVDREIHSHLTCATDTNNIRVVFDVVTDVIIKMNMAYCNLC